MIYAVPLNDGKSSAICIRELNGTILFNETVEKSGIQSIIPLGYVGNQAPSKILGFLFVDMEDWTMWFYNI